MKENNQCYLAAAEVFSRLREWVSIDSPWALACSLSPPPPRPPPSSPHSSASFTGWSRGVPHNGIINTQAPGAAPLSRCSDPPAAVHAGSCSLQASALYRRLAPSQPPVPGGKDLGRGQDLRGGAGQPCHPTSALTQALSLPYSCRKGTFL